MKTRIDDLFSGAANARFLVSGAVSAVLLGLAPAAQGASFAQLNLSTSLTNTASVSDPQKVQQAFQDDGLNANNEAYHYRVKGAADLTTGTLRGLASVNNYPYVNFTNILTDSLIVEGTPLSTISVTFEFQIDGTADLNAIGDNSRQIDFGASLRTGAGSELQTSSYRHFWNINAIGEGGTETYYTTPANDTANVDIVSASKGAFDVILHQTRELSLGADGRSGGIPFEMRIFGTASSAQGGGAFLDVEHTGRARILLPEGYSFTSSSGVFLTQPVPLPASLPLLGAGCALLGLIRRHGRRSAVSEKA